MKANGTTDILIFMALSYELREHMVTLAGACCESWGSLFSFLGGCGVPSSLYAGLTPVGNNRYTTMRHVLLSLDRAGEQALIDRIISAFYRLDVLDLSDRNERNDQEVNELLTTFRELVGRDPLESHESDR